MKSKRELTTNKVPAIHQHLSRMVDAAHYDLAQLESMKRFQDREVSAKRIKAIIRADMDRTLPKYHTDTATGKPSHKFSDAYLRPLYQAVRFNSRPQTHLVSIRMTASTPMWHDFVIDNPNVKKKLLPWFKTGKDISKAFELATSNLSEDEMEAKRITIDGWLQQQVINAISYDFIAVGFLNAGMSDFIIANDDTFLVLPEDLHTAQAVIKEVADKLRLDGILYFRNEQ